MKTIKDYPVQTVCETADHIMWIFTGKWSPIDNFALTPVKADVGHGSLLYPTSEHAFAAAKSDNWSTAEQIRKAETPGEAKGMGRTCALRPEWEQVKFQVMWYVLQAKFAQHPKCVNVLLKTGDQPIFEGNTWDDDVWGVIRVQDNVWRGRNALGEQLMELRNKYKGAQK